MMNDVCEKMGLRTSPTRYVERAGMTCLSPRSVLEKWYHDRTTYAPRCQ